MQLFTLLLLSTLLFTGCVGVERVEKEGPALTLQFVRVEGEGSTPLRCPQPEAEIAQIRSTYPLLPFLFFDLGSATLPSQEESRRVVPYSPEMADSLLPGGTLQKNSYLLDIVAWRMRRFSADTLQIIPSYSDEPGESAQLAFERGEAVRRYLIDTGRVAPGRLLVEPAILVGCDSADSICREDARHVLLRSSARDILQWISLTEYYRHVVADSLEVTFTPRRAVREGERVEVRLLWEDGDISLRRELLPGSDQNYHGTFPWEFSLLPGDERSHDPFARRAGRVVVQVLDSDEEVSERESVWVLEQVTLDPTRVVSRTGHGTRRGFALPLYSEGMMGESEEQLRFLRAEIVPQLRRAKRMTIQGHCSNGENPWLESFRAGSVRDALMAIDSVGVASLEEVVVGPGGGWLFSQDSPDGRAHSRTVVVYLYY